MKKLILIALVLTGLTTNAQYFQHLYGSAANDEYGVSGTNINTVAPAGQFMVGVGLSCLPVSSIPATYTRLNGNVPGPPHFNENYVLANPAGAMLNVTGLPQAMELSTCGLFGIVGSYTDPSVTAPGNSGVFFMQVAAGGGVTAVFNYIPPAGSGWDIVDVTGAKKSIVFPGDWYITGTALDPTGLFKVFAMRINECSGAMVWSVMYDIQAPVINAWGRDIDENLMNPFGFQSAAIVGKVNDGVSDDAFLFHIDANNGVPAPHPVIITGSPNTTEEWRSIRQAQAGPLPPGFILGGTTDLYGNKDFMVTRMDGLIAPFFTNVYDYSVNPNTDNICYDVIERLNSACNYEYYAIGNASNGAFGGSDVMVVKMDQFGVTIPGDEFTYGGGGNDYATKIDQRTTTPCAAPPPNLDGLTMFGSTQGSFTGLGGADMYMIKAYFNGISGCNEMFNNPILLGGMQPNPMMPVVDISKMVPDVNLLAIHNKNSDVTLCFANIIGGGNNARVAPKDEGKEANQAILVMPNPTAAASQEVKLEVNSNIAGDVEVEIYDLLGKKQYSHQHTLVKGKNTLPIDLSTTTMAAGTYSVKMKGETQTQTVILIVK